jgi:hypothetical protein
MRFVVAVHATLLSIAAGSFLCPMKTVPHTHEQAAVVV